MDPEYRVGNVASLITNSTKLKKQNEKEKTEPKNAALSKLFSAPVSVVNTRPVVKINIPKKKILPPPADGPSGDSKMATPSTNSNNLSNDQRTRGIKKGPGVSVTVDQTPNKSSVSNPPKELNKRSLRAEKFREIKKVHASRLAAAAADEGSGAMETEPTEPPKQPNTDTDEKLSRTIFIGNLPVSATKKSLVKLFRGSGKVTSARLRSAIPGENTKTKKAAIIKKDFHATNTTLNGFVVFDRPEFAKDALKKNGTILDGLHIRVDLAVNSRQHDHRRSIFVGNLSFDVKDEDFRRHFERFGDVDSVRVIRDNRTGLGKGFGYILFKDRDSVTFALRAKDGTGTLNGRQLRVKSSTDDKYRISASVSKNVHQKPQQRPQSKPGPITTPKLKNRKLTGFDAVKDRKIKRKEKKKKMTRKLKGKLGEKIFGKKVINAGSGVTVGYRHTIKQNTDHTNQLKPAQIVNQNTTDVSSKSQAKKNF